VRVLFFSLPFAGFQQLYQGYEHQKANSTVGLANENSLFHWEKLILQPYQGLALRNVFRKFIACIELKILQTRWLHSLTMIVEAHSESRRTVATPNASTPREDMKRKLCSLPVAMDRGYPGPSQFAGLTLQRLIPRQLS
jgi:hypothetical protein